MAELKTIADYLNTLLDIRRFPDDASNNGLQIEGTPVVNKIAFGVDASLVLAEKAAEAGADMIFVHHGLSWGTGFRRITGVDAARIATLLKNDISLYAAHLPLDAHPVIGHNAVIAETIDLINRKMFAEYANDKIGVRGELPKAMGAASLADMLEDRLGFDTAVYGKPRGKLKRIGVVSGGAGTDGILAAAAKNLDCLITGEIGHSHWHLINELALTVITGGHYNTEKPGIKALIEDVENMFDVECVFFDIPTGL